ncbi:hypothetical protein [Longitalea arenae]|uniref:hypothetical protein n=1 Tax=Longitalea arenae TaxID=2812558 RepID=UPI001968713B|nr:hypothetical protein [Longitalea arenae]
MLAVHLFNLGGYTLLFEYFTQRSDEQLTKRLDNDQYDNSELIEVKVALHMPYIQSRTGYERVDGEAEVDGFYYSYVKRKISNDTLYLLCLPNKQKTELNAARIEYVGKAHDAPVNAKDTHAFKKNPAGIEYNQPEIHYAVPVLSMATKEPGEHPTPPVTLTCISGPFHPPQG